MIRIGYYFKIITTIRFLSHELHLQYFESQYEIFMVFDQPIWEKQIFTVKRCILHTFYIHFTWPLMSLLFNDFYHFIQYIPDKAPTEPGPKFYTQHSNSKYDIRSHHKKVETLKTKTKQKHF